MPPPPGGMMPPMPPEPPQAPPAPEGYAKAAPKEPDAGGDALRRLLILLQSDYNTIALTRLCNLWRGLPVSDWLPTAPTVATATPR